MTKTDFKKLDAYRAGPAPRLVTLDPQRYLAVDGHGDPNTAPAYQQALQTLYPVAYKLKFASKNAGRDYVVPPLEGLWWAEDMESFTSARDKSAWDWTMLLLIPDWIGEEEIEMARADAQRARELPAIDKLYIARLSEDACAQVLHTGSYDAEGPVIKRLHAWAAGQGWALAGKHHEIYLSDPRRTAPEKLKTILRQPLKSAQ